MSRRVRRQPARYFEMSITGLLRRLRRRGFFQGESWRVWEVILRAAFGEALTEAELVLFKSVAGDRNPPAGRVSELDIVKGRRAGGSLVVALIAFYFAVCGIFPGLAPGEKGIVGVFASDRRQARIIFDYIAAFFAVAPFSDLVVRQTQEEIELTNGIVIEVHTNSFRALRGRTYVVAICDELAYWLSDGANPDSEVIAAIVPGMVTIPQAMLILVSSPYARRGVLWERFKKYFGQSDENTLVIQGPSRVLNPSLPQAVISKAYQDDPAAASAEYGAQFRTDVESYVRREAVDACVVPGRYELPVLPGVEYQAGFDASGGSGQDEMTLAVSHLEQRDGRSIAVLDVIAGIMPPFSPEQAVGQFIDILNRYQITRVVGDRFAGEWPREPFTKADVRYELTDKPKSDLYRELLPAINSGLVELLDEPKMINQLCDLERRTARGGRDSIDHVPNGHDDRINVAAIALLSALREGQRPKFDISICRDARDFTDEERERLIEKERTAQGQMVDRTVLNDIRADGLFR